MIKKILLVFFVLMVIPSVLQSASMNDSIKVKDRFMDLKNFAYYVAEKNKWSLIVGNDISVPIKEVNGDTIKDILDNYCKNSEIGWHFEKNCLYIGDNKALNTYFSHLKTLEKSLPNGNNATYSGYFRNMDFSMLCSSLSSISGTKIRLANNLDANIMMRVNGMPWKRVLLAVVMLNKYKMNVTDFSMLITPES